MCFLKSYSDFCAATILVYCGGSSYWLCGPGLKWLQCGRRDWALVQLKEAIKGYRSREVRRFESLIPATCESPLASAGLRFIAIIQKTRNMFCRCQENSDKLGWTRVYLVFACQHNFGYLPYSSLVPSMPRTYVRPIYALPPQRSTWSCGVCRCLARELHCGVIMKSCFIFMTLDFKAELVG